MDFNLAPPVREPSEYFGMVSAALQEGHSEEEEPKETPDGDE